MLKPIETTYKGYKFRSRLEARWAIFFDTLGIDWEYEPEGFDLGDGDYYLPDFYLTETGAWAEVKACEFNQREQRTATKLVKQSLSPVLKLIGSPSLEPYAIIELVDLGTTEPSAETMHFHLSDYFGCYTIDEAVTAARSARFEWGKQ